MKHTHHHLLISFAIMSTMIAALVFFYMKYTVNSMTDEIVTAMNEEATLQSSDSLESRLQQLQNTSAKDWERIYSVFVPSDNAVPFIEAVESLGKNTGSTVTIVSVDNTKPDNGSLAANGYINAKVSVRGSWSAVLATLELAENMPYKATVDGVNLNLSQEAKAKVSAEWTASFSITAAKSI
ncbi:MAG: hypothetical protein WCG02_00145 [Candidatus Taylorbacteria bacterium]